MLVDAVRALYDYNGWATERVLDAAARLTSDQWLEPGSAGRGSIRDTLLHLIATQKGWLAWWDGSLPPEQAQARRLEPADFPDASSVRMLLSTVQQSTLVFLGGLSDIDLERIYSNPMPNGVLFRLALWQMMLHVANHGTQHRSEVAAMLTAYGHSPGDLDLLGFFRPFGDSMPGAGQ